MIDDAVKFEKFRRSDGGPMPTGSEAARKTQAKKTDRSRKRSKEIRLEKGSVSGRRHRNMPW